MSSYPFCTDEDILIRSSSDFLLMRTLGQRLAGGSDGYFLGSGPWTLRSDSVEFGSYGIPVGSVVVLADDVDLGRYGSDGSALVIEEANGHELSLRLPGLESGVGQPPGDPDGNSGVRFLVVSFGSQIESASYAIRNQFGIDPRLDGRGADNLYDSRALQELCVLTVLRRLYLSSWARSRDDLWKNKSDQAGIEISHIKPSISLRWGPEGDDGPPTTRASARISR